VPTTAQLEAGGVGECAHPRQGPGSRKPRGAVAARSRGLRADPHSLSRPRLPVESEHRLPRQGANLIPGRPGFGSSGCVSLAQHLARLRRKDPSLAPQIP
jgi:hypothetical protein